MSIETHHYEDSPFLTREATSPEGIIIPELWQAIIQREVAVDQVVAAATFDKPEMIEESGYFEKARVVRELQEIYGIEP